MNHSIRLGLAMLFLIGLTSNSLFAKMPKKEKKMNNSEKIIEIVTKMSQAMERGDLEAAQTAYEPNAALVVQPGVTATGAAFREAMSGFVMMKPKFIMPKHEVIEAGNIALHIAPWTMKAHVAVKDGR